MNSMQKIGKIEAILLIIMITANQIILNLHNAIMKQCGPSSWINVIVISIIAVLFCLWICKLFKPFPSQDIVDISEYLGSKTLKIIVGTLYVTFFVFMAGIFLRYFSNSLKTIYFKESPLVFLLLLFLIPSVYVARLGIKPIAHINFLLTPIVLVSIVVLVSWAAKVFVPQRLLPVFGFGIDKTLFLGLNNIFTFNCFAYLYFLIPVLKEPEDFKKVAVSSIIISAIYLFLSVFCLVMLFPFISFSDEIISLYLVARMVEFGRFFQRVDAIFILIWILCCFSFLSITIELINRIIKKITNIKENKVLPYSIGAIIFSLTLSFRNIADIKFIQNVYLKYIVIFLVFIFSLVILLLANYKFKRRNKNE